MVAQGRSELLKNHMQLWQKCETPLARAVMHAGLCWGQSAGQCGPVLSKETDHHWLFSGAHICGQPSIGQQQHHGGAVVISCL